MELHQLIRSSQAGDEEAFEHLYKQYASRALRTVYLIHPNRQEAQDIVQEAFLLAWRSLGSLREVEAFSVWFYRILVRLIHRRRKKMRGIRFVPYQAEFHDRPDVTSPNPEERVEHSEELAMLRKAVNGLPDMYRVPLVLRYYCQLAESEVAKVLSIPVGTVKSRLNHARKLVSKYMTTKSGQTRESITPCPGVIAQEVEVQTKCLKSGS